ncbi:two-component system response regulator YcbB [Pectinatus cerevisiiphilus]|uniref:Two-component system response regulator YcbB n=2 Tax=Pectinatus cerevisiiphilus TaxID=86956 RepID=A0A4R3K3R4_9FIRM|nr:two-component system response regulator YcbB [Pectinatus cerevisiiphilus]
MIVDDDKAVCTMLQDIIEDYELGEVVVALDNAVSLDNKFLRLKKIDILIIDMLMPVRDGMQTVKDIKGDFKGKIIMLSQVENKEMVGKAYAAGVDYYITKPINRNEVVGVIRAVSEHTCLKNFVDNIRMGLHTVYNPEEVKRNSENRPFSIVENGRFILKNMGIDSEANSQEILLMLQQLEQDKIGEIEEFPSLKSIFSRLALEKKGKDVQKDSKAIEQRLRRTIFQAMVNIASIGIVDLTNPKFDDYASRYFDLAEVYALMRSLKQGEKPQITQTHINSKKFLRTLYIECSKRDEI